MSIDGNRGSHSHLLSVSKLNYSQFVVLHQLGRDFRKVLWFKMCSRLFSWRKEVSGLFFVELLSIFWMRQRLDALSWFLSFSFTSCAVLPTSFGGKRLLLRQGLVAKLLPEHDHQLTFFSYQDVFHVLYNGIPEPGVESWPFTFTYAVYWQF